ncbi:hypothetical protein R1sor_006423 [Riccia sorocarpa]|uniref:Ubiquitin-like protease family profile domain-containing protein n=1 Tax=Riccia sorocarpa TaxID=122646 RepID=A0ABD3HQZ9_9MARC
MASTLTMAMEKHTRVWKFWASLEDQLAQAKKEEEVLKAKISDLEEEKRIMNERVAMMEKKDLYELLEAKMQGYQIANHPGMLGDFENLNLTITRKWTAIPTLNLDMFEKCPVDYPDFAPFAAAKWIGWKDNCPLCVHPLGFLPSINTGVCKHMFHFNCFWKYTSTRRICPKCRTALPDSTYEFFCTIFVPEGIESIDPKRARRKSWKPKWIKMSWNLDVVVMFCGMIHSSSMAGLDADNFTMEKLLDTNVPKTPDDVGPDFEESLSEHARLKLKSDLLAIVDGPPRVTRSTRTRLEYNPIVVSASSPTKHVLLEGNFDTLGLSSPPIPICSPAIIPSHPPSIPIDLTNDGLDDPFSPPWSQIVSVDTFVDLAQYISSPENKGSKDQGWPSKCDLTKEDLESGMLPGKHLRGDVINVYIKERFLDRDRDKMHNMFFVNTFWFPKASKLVDRYDRTSHSEEAMISIARLRRSISPKLHDGDSQEQLPAWIFVPIHGSNHWSLAIIRLHREFCHIVRLDSCVDIHIPTAIFHVLKTFISLTMKVDVTKIEHQSWPVDQQKDDFSCGIHVLQMLTGVDMREADLDRCFWQESFNSIATTDNVTNFWMMLGLYLGGKLEVPPT